MVNVFNAAFGKNAFGTEMDGLWVEIQLVSQKIKIK